MRRSFGITDPVGRASPKECDRLVRETVSNGFELIAFLRRSQKLLEPIGDNSRIGYTHTRLAYYLSLSLLGALDVVRAQEHLSKAETLLSEPSNRRGLLQLHYANAEACLHSVDTRAGLQNALHFEVGTSALLKSEAGRSCRTSPAEVRMQIRNRTSRIARRGLRLLQRARRLRRSIRVKNVYKSPPASNQKVGSKMKFEIAGAVTLGCLCLGGWPAASVDAKTTKLGEGAVAFEIVGEVQQFWAWCNARYFRDLRLLDEGRRH